MIRGELLRDADDMAVLFNATPNNIDQILIKILQGPDTQLKRLILSDGWLFQEKHNGDRRLVEKSSDAVRDYNRKGEQGKGLPPEVRYAIKHHPMFQFILDVELVKSDIFLFDLLYYGQEALVARPYSYREAMYHAQFTGYPHIIPVKSARTPEEKIALIQRLVNERAEGFVAKEASAVYRPADGDQRWNYRYKLYKTLDAIVIGDSTKRVNGSLRDSVRLGCFDDNGKLWDICGATKKTNIPVKPGDVVEIKYLYGTGTLDVVQPTILRKRDDKLPQECKLSQIIVNKNWSEWRKQ